MTGSNGSRAAMYAASSLWRRMMRSIARCAVAASSHSGVSRPCASKTKGCHADGNTGSGWSRMAVRKPSSISTSSGSSSSGNDCRSSSSSETSVSDRGAVSASLVVCGFIIE